MGMISIAILAAIAIVLGVILGVALDLWLGLVSKPSDKAGEYHLKSLGAALPILYVLLSWVALVVSVNANSVAAMEVHPVHVPLHYIPGFILSVLPIPIFGKVLDGLSPPVTEASRGTHDHHLEHGLYGIIIYIPICVIGFVIFAIWPTVLGGVFGWVRGLGAYVP